MEFISMGLHKQMGNVDLKFLPSQLAGLQLWTRFNKGITITGSGVSQWDDQSGNGNHLKQATDANRPSKETDGSILFDGTNDFLLTNGLTLNQPMTIYILGQQVSWTSGDRIMAGASGITLYQQPSTPSIRLYPGTTTIDNTEWTIGTDVVVTIVVNDTSSLLQVNNGTPIIGGSGTVNMGDIYLGSAVGGTLSSNIKIKEIPVYSAVHDAETRLKVINYLAGIGGLSI